MAVMPARVRFDLHKDGTERGLDAAPCPSWTGIVPNGAAHTLDFVEVLLVHRGLATVHVAGAREQVRGPSIVVTRPDVERRVDLQAPLALDVVVFPERVVRRLGASAVLASIATGVRPADPADLSDLATVGRLLRLELTAAHEDAPLMLDALLMQFVVRLRRACPVAGAPVTPRILARFERLLEQHFREEHRVAAYAGRLGVTADYLSAAARQHEGRSAKALIERRLLREATYLLSATDQTIAGVAAALGFDEPSHFSRAFRRWSGLSPQRLRSPR